MKNESLLNHKTILIVDDEQDILDTVEELLPMCMVTKATNYDTAVEYLLGYTYDIVILDIMGVDGFNLLKKSVERGFPAVILSAHAVTVESLKKSIELGAVYFLPKDELSELHKFLEDVVLEGGKPLWIKLFNRLDSNFKKRFGSDWKEKEASLKELESAFWSKEREKLNDK